MRMYANDMRIETSDLSKKHSVPQRDWRWVEMEVAPSVDLQELQTRRTIAFRPYDGLSKLLTYQVTNVKELPRPFSMKAFLTHHFKERPVLRLRLQIESSSFIYSSTGSFYDIVVRIPLASNVEDVTADHVTALSVPRKVLCCPAGTQSGVRVRREDDMMVWRIASMKDKESAVATFDLTVRPLAGGAVDLDWGAGGEKKITLSYSAANTESYLRVWKLDQVGVGPQPGQGDPKVTKLIKYSSKAILFRQAFPTL